MNRKNYFFGICFAVINLFCVSLYAEIKLPEVLGDNMVLQRNKPVIIWGTAGNGEKISVTFGRQVKHTTAGQDGQWQITLDPMAASKVPAEMQITGSDSILLKNILVGEVWLCSGQSNMEYTMTKSTKHAQAKNSQGMPEEELNRLVVPELRLFLVKRSLLKKDGSNTGWNQAGGTALRAFSAAGYYFGKKLLDELDVPVGIIASSIPGSRIEPWTSAEAYASSPEFKTGQTGQPVKIDGTEPGKFYYSMIQPLAPFALSGFLWYQGESNCFLKETDSYTRKMRVLIDNWRQTWNDSSLPFYFVQIAPFYYSKSRDVVTKTEETLPEFREAQTAALQVSNTAMVVTTDLVDDINDIHPSYKWEIGNRLALVALNKHYGRKKIVCSGPVFQEMKKEGNTIKLKFTETGGGLKSRDGKPLTWFAISGADGKFVPANAVIKGNQVWVSATGVLSPVHVRFAWNEAAQPNLVNKEGLPARPFRTDTSIQPFTKL